VLAALLAISIALPVDPAELLLYTEPGHTLGIAENGGELYAVIESRGSVVRFGGAGQIAEERAIQGLHGPAAPQDLCFAGDVLAVTDASLPGVLFLDAKSSEPRGALPLPGMDPTGITYDGEALWVADRARLELVRLDPGTGERLRTLRAPGSGPRALDWRQGKLWHLDSIDQTAYRMDPETGVVEAGVWVPPGSARGLIVRDGTLDVSLSASGAIVRMPYLENDRYTLCMPVRARVEVRCTVTPDEGAGSPEGAEGIVAIPSSDERQDVGEVVPYPTPTRSYSDEHGQPVVAWDVPALGGDESFRCGWRTEVELGAIRYKPEGRSDEPTPDAVYLREDRYTTLDAEPIRELTRDLPKEAIAALRTVADRICDRMNYVRDGTWEPADEVLLRGTGSCSEFSYIFAAAARSLGYPVRLAGGTVLHSASPVTHPARERVDRPMHRWPEVFVAGPGWLPIDPTRMDRGDRPPHSSRYFLALGANTVVCSRGPGHEGAALDQRYLDSFLRPEDAEDRWRYDREIGWTLPDPPAWEIAAARRARGE